VEWAVRGSNPRSYERSVSRHPGELRFGAFAGERLAPERVAIEGRDSRCRESGLVVGEEDLADQLAPAANAGLLEALLQVLLDGVGETARRSAIWAGRVAA
jgi:hypothetical protein